jgi:Potassium-transporting ATPase A subunit
MALRPRVRSSVRRDYGTGIYYRLDRIGGCLVVLALRAALAREVLGQEIHGDAKQTEKYRVSAKTGDVMTVNGWIQILLFAAIIFAITKPLGRYMHRVFEGYRQPFPRLFGGIERLLHKLCGVDPQQQQDWKQYTLAMLVFSAITLLVTYGIERLQHVLPLNPQNFPPVAPDLAFNTAASFTTNTNWQSYSGESTMSYLTQMGGLAWHNFISAAVGIGIALALARGNHLPLASDSSKDNRQLLGRSYPVNCLCFIAYLDSSRVAARFSGSHSKFFILRGGDDLGGREANLGDGSGSVAGNYQRVGHQRRRIFQR